jgi:hypothetical protein
MIPFGVALGHVVRSLPSGNPTLTLRVEFAGKNAVRAARAHARERTPEDRGIESQRPDFRAIPFGVLLVEDRYRLG